MNGALSPEMLRGSEMTVLERQRAHLKWHQEQSYFDDLTGAFSSQSSRELGFRPGYMCGGDSVLLQTKPDPGLESGWPDLLNVKIQLPGLVCGSGGSGNGSSPETNFAPRTSGGSPATAEENRQDSSGQENVSSGAGRESFKKRKAVHLQHTKVVVDDELSQTKECAEEGDSKITEQKTKKSCSKKSIKKETSTTTAKENSKASVVEKPDYIHVRARRGQATDSHSLAERVRREKISERMKYLQGLVPGCDKITGKAGMLDEIINYVQSLQRQIEFLSLKLATVNPRLDFNIDNLLTKEIIHASTSSFQTCGILSETTNPAYLQMDASQQQVGSSCGLDMGMSSPDMGLRRATYAPISSVPDAFLGPSCFTQTQPSTSWDAELQSLYSMVFDQGKAI